MRGDKEEGGDELSFLGVEPAEHTNQENMPRCTEACTSESCEGVVFLRA